MEKVEICIACNGNGTLRKVGKEKICRVCYEKLMMWKRVRMKSGGEIKIIGTEIVLERRKTDAL